jgi:hypothetical protein
MESDRESGVHDVAMKDEISKLIIHFFFTKDLTSLMALNDTTKKIYAS